MKAVSLWQPWAGAMARGFKKNETRSWPTSHRGDLVICSAKHRISEDIDPDVFQFGAGSPLGFALCIVSVFDCLPTESFFIVEDGKRKVTTLNPTEQRLGNYSLGRFAWLTGNLRILKTPVPVRGFQGIWNLSQEIEAQIKEQAA